MDTTINKIKNTIKGYSYNLADEKEGLVEELKQINIGYNDFVISARKANINSILNDWEFDNGNNKTNG